MFSIDIDLVSKISKNLLAESSGFVDTHLFVCFIKSVSKILRFPIILFSRMMFDFAWIIWSNLVGPKSRIMVSGDHGHDQ